MEEEITVEEIRKSLSHSFLMTVVWNTFDKDEQEELAKHFYRLNGVPVLSMDYIKKFVPEEILNETPEGYRQRIAPHLN